MKTSVYTLHTYRYITIIIFVIEIWNQNYEKLAEVTSESRCFSHNMFFFLMFSKLDAAQSKQKEILKLSYLSKELFLYVYWHSKIFMMGVRM